jgi:hypothetical protein
MPKAQLDSELCRKETTNLMKSMATLWDDMGLLAREPKAKTEGFKADWALFLVLWILLVCNYGHRGDVHDRIRMGGGPVAVVGCGGRSRIDRAQGRGASAAEDGGEGETVVGRGRSSARRGVRRGKGRLSKLIGSPLLVGRRPVHGEDRYRTIFSLALNLLIKYFGMSSLAYHQFLPPIDPARNGFDFHVYYAPADVPHAQSLHSRISLEFPEASKMHS